MKLYQPLIISFLIHLCLLLFAQLAPSQSHLKPKNQNVEIVYQNETKTQQFVTSPDKTEIKKAIEKLKSAADKLSRYTERVKMQTRVAKSGPTQNIVSESPSRPLAQQLSDELKSPILNPVARNTRMGDSSLAEYIPEVKVGGFTALNTDQFVHYTFYARTNEQIRNRWIMNVRNFLNLAPQTEINRLSQQPQVSQVEIVLDSNGRFVKALIHQHSQNPDVDQSAIEAFRQAAPLNNPPAEMIERDGFIHLHYAFHIHFRPRYIASGSK